MRITIGEVVEKINSINCAIRVVNEHIDHNCYDSLSDAVELLEEYRDLIRTADVDIRLGD